MKYYQDTQNGMIHAFEDGYDPFAVNNRNIPKTLTANVVPKPDDSHVWYQGGWIKQQDAPLGYVPPISSVPSYNPAWMAHLRPYSAVYRNASSGLKITLEQINANSYDGSRLAEVVATLPLRNASGIPAIISYDGAIAIPQCEDFPTSAEGVRKLNEVLCSLLLGGIQAEVVHSEDLVVGCLHENSGLFAYTPSLHSFLRLNWAALADRMAPLMHPRVLMVDDMRKAFHQGQEIIQRIYNFTPLFLLSGYTAMIYQNTSDALNNLWITIEQLTNYLLSEKCNESGEILDNTETACVKFEKGKKIVSISKKHKRLYRLQIISEHCYKVLVCAASKRNALAHQGSIPDLHITGQLWGVLPELLEVASGVKSLGMRKLSGSFSVGSSGIPPKTDFEEWKMLAEAHQATP